MQTFLPYPNFVASARALDWRRLGKQRVEGRQLQTAIQRGDRTGWGRHPAALMWEKHVVALMAYTDCCIREWQRRGYENNMPLMLEVDAPYFLTEVVMPPWLGDPAFHSAHRAALLYKDPDWYGQFGWTEEPKLDYIWPEVL